ncbi:MAG: hypothetical protein K6F15_10275 [Treponema sp.]|nr:hypothetical protein [Treponema sp.]
MSEKLLNKFYIYATTLLTASGIARVPVNKDEEGNIYKRVDNRLYYAKQHGKNQISSED